MMPTMLPVTEAKPKMNELLRRAEAEDIYLARHGRPVAVIIGIDRYEELLDDLEDAKDRLSVHEALADSDDRVPYDEAVALAGPGRAPQVPVRTDSVTRRARQTEGKLAVQAAKRAPKPKR